MLREVANRLLISIRSADTAARVGGDEFVVVAENLEPTEAALMAGRIVAGVARPISYPDGEVEIGISVGITFRNGHQPRRTPRPADPALYEVKRSGGGHFRVAEGEP